MLVNGARDVVDGDRSFGDVRRQHDLGPESGGSGLRARDMVSGRVRTKGEGQD